MKQLLTSTIVFVLAISLAIITIPIGVLYALFRFRGHIEYASRVLKRIAVSFDQIINVVCGPIFNRIFIYRLWKWSEFGLEDDTVSEVLARNRKLGALTPLGRRISNALEWLDPGHLDNSLIENTPYDQ